MASLRRIGVPLAQIKVILGLDARAAAEQVAGYWTGAEAGHAAAGNWPGDLVDRLNEKRSAMYEVAVRDIPARSLLTLLRHVHADEQIPVGESSSSGGCGAGRCPALRASAGRPS